MRDKVVHNGRVSCFCSKCYSKNVYYLQQKKVILSISPNGNLIRNQENGGWETLRSVRKRLFEYEIAWHNAKTECLSLVCRDCGNCKTVKLL